MQSTGKVLNFVIFLMKRTLLVDGYYIFHLK